MSWYVFFKNLTGAFVRTVSSVRVEGRENIPDHGPFLLLPNHQSALDPIYIQSSIRRNDVFTLTKSTQFASGFFRWVLPRLNALPTRRFRVDPQVVRMVLRHLEQGHGVCVYPEGERTWDGRIQPLRRGALRLVLKVGVPVIPCGIDGSFDVLPRWSRSIRRTRVTIRFGEPIHFGAFDDREERNARLGETEAAIHEALSALSGTPVAGSETDSVSESSPGEGAGRAAGGSS